VRRRGDVAWLGFKPYYLENLKPLSFYLERFSGEMMRNCSRQDFISWYRASRLARSQQS
jgi:hypothetical protein